MTLSNIWILIIALVPSFGAVISSIVNVVRSTRTFQTIVDVCNLKQVQKKLDKQLIENAKLSTEIKNLYKLIYKLTNKVEVSDEDVEKLISGNKE